VVVAVVDMVNTQDQVALAKVVMVVVVEFKLVMCLKEKKWNI
jgi:hypothetical protein